jgi:hypothetical protein
MLSTVYVVPLALDVKEEPNEQEIFSVVTVIVFPLIG